MLLIGLTSLLMAIPLYSSTITPTLLTRMTSIMLLFSAALSFNALYVQAIGSGLGLYSGLFHVTSVTQAMEIFLFVTGAFILLPWAPVFTANNSINASSSFPGTTMIPTIPEYPLIILFTTIGASFLISSSDLVSMYLSIELQSFAVYILAAIYRNSESATSAGLKYFLLGALSSALILLGSSIIYAYTGLTSFESIYMLTSVAGQGASVNLGSSAGIPLTGHETISQGIVLGVLIIAVGFLFKVAAAPFHNWAPDVYDGVPTIVTTWLTVMPKISIFIFLLELQIGSDTSLPLETLSTFFEGSTMNVWKNLLLTTSLLSLVVGTVVGLAQYRLKRLLAFSTISHVGFLLLALSVNSEDSITSFLFYLMQYSITNLDAFFVVLAFGYIIHSSLEEKSTNSESTGYSSYSQSTFSKDHQLPKGTWSQGTGNMKGRTDSTDISFIAQLKGQFHANPVLGLSLAICLFSMAGIPPLVGFFAKYMVLYSAIENGYYFLALVGIMASVVSAAYYLRIIRVIHFDTSLSGRMTEGHSTFPALGNVPSDNFASGTPVMALTSTHSYIIAVLTLFITLYILSPSLFLNSSNLLALSLFTA
jgi:NADH-ubiquinone oxidoreductase chain 2